MEFPSDRKYSDYHLWVKVERDLASIGITEHAVEELGEIDYIELPEPDEILTKNRSFGVIETSKAVTDLVAPISGTVVEINTSAVESPEGLGDDPYGDGWLILVEPSDPDELDELLSAGAYKELLDNQDDE
jgi:glycine cleavage system H protein